MKKKFLRLVWLMVLFVMTASLSACAFVEELLHTHEFKPKTDQENHWLECSCGEIKDREAHQFATNKDQENHWLECSCGETKERSTHIWDNGVITIEPTLQTVGEKTYTCSCGETKTEEVPKLIPSTGEFAIHFMTLGNDNAGDCIYIKAGEVDILIDGGSKANSVDDITSYVDQYVTDGTIEYVIVTHADQDHIACYGITNGSLFDYYECEVIIDFPLTDKTTQVYNRYQNERNDEVTNGAKHFTALECYNETEEGAQRVYNLADGISMEILYNYYYENESADENNYSVCVQFIHGSRKFLFTGDLEEEGEEYLVQYNELSQVEFYKAGHHGSKTSSTDALLNVIQPKTCVVTCVCGTDEYTDTEANQFPTQAFIDRISKHTDKVYVPSLGDDEILGEDVTEEMNGDIIISSTQSGVEVICSNNDILLKDTEWFRVDRVCPPDWLD